MTPQTIVAIISACIAGTALVISSLAYILTRQNAVVARRPVLVFEWTETTGWQIRNPGNGPAMNIRVSVRGKQTRWTSPVIVPAIPSGATFDLAWIGLLNAWMLGAEYEDFGGLAYTTISQHDQNLAEEGHRLSEFADYDKDYLVGRNATRAWNAQDLSSDDTLT
jgi:hypothetical protein